MLKASEGKFKVIVIVTGESKGDGRRSCRQGGGRQTLTYSVIYNTV